jgi:hypothetical protein
VIDPFGPAINANSPGIYPGLSAEINGCLAFVALTLGSDRYFFTFT